MKINTIDPDMFDTFSVLIVFYSWCLPLLFLLTQMYREQEYMAVQIFQFNCLQCQNGSFWVARCALPVVISHKSVIIGAEVN